MLLMHGCREIVFLNFSLKCAKELGLFHNSAEYSLSLQFAGVFLQEVANF